MFEHQAERAGVLVVAWELEYHLGGILVGALPVEPAELVDVLGRQPQVCHHRDAEVGQALREVNRVRSALHFHGGGVRLLEHPAAVLDGVALVGAGTRKRHVCDDDRVLGGAGDRSRRARHLVDCDYERRLVVNFAFLIWVRRRATVINVEDRLDDERGRIWWTTGKLSTQRPRCLVCRSYRRRRTRRVWITGG